MRGVSWGGFSTLQAAALAPPALKAIMPMCASDRRYTDDAHYVGGAFALTGLKWATSFKAVMAGPPDPEVFGPGLGGRLDGAPGGGAADRRPLAVHQREDDYWRQGSVGFDPGAIRCPVYLVGGWVDPYNEMIPRLLERLQVPAKALIGPWQHGYPSPAAPGPGLDWAFEEVRWWQSTWLAAKRPGSWTSRGCWAFLPEQSADRSRAGRASRPLGRRAGLAAGDGDAELAPERRSARVDGGAGGGANIATAAWSASQTPEWVPFAAPTYPQEQSPDDARSLVFDTDPLDAAARHARNAGAAVCGSPPTAPVARLAARLCEVTPDGRSWLVTYGVLNLTHRDSHAAPTPLTPGVFYDVDAAALPDRPPPARRLAAAASAQREPLAAAVAIADAGDAEPRSRPRCAGATGQARARCRGADADLPRARIAQLGVAAIPASFAKRHDDGLTRYEEIWPLASSTIGTTGTRIERSGANVEASILPPDPDELPLARLAHRPLSPRRLGLHAGGPSGAHR